MEVRNNLKSLVSAAEFVKMDDVVILTHPGVMHADELMSIAIINYFRDVPAYIVRSTGMGCDMPLSDYILVIDTMGSTLDHHYPKAKEATVSLVWDWMKPVICEKITEYSWSQIKKNLIDPISETDLTGKMNSFNYIINMKKAGDASCDIKFMELVTFCMDIFTDVMNGAINSKPAEKAFLNLPILEVNGLKLKVNEDRHHFIRFLQDSGFDGLISFGYERGTSNPIVKIQSGNISKWVVKSTAHDEVFVHPNGFMGEFKSLESALDSITLK